jgi:hypothetical protein
VVWFLIIVCSTIFCAHVCGTCIWSLYLTVDTIFQSLWFLSGFPW